MAFSATGKNEVLSDECGNVYMCIKGRGETPPVVVSAHLDTVFPIETDLSITTTPEKIMGPGIGDNSLGLAGLFGLYWSITTAMNGHKKTLPLAGDLWLVANVGEEGLGNLKGMKNVVDRFGSDVLAYIVLEGISLGQIYHRGLGVRRYSISVQTKGGHSWLDYGSPSAIHEIADIIVKIKGLNIPAEPRTSINIGVISGGSSVNTIAAEASLQLDLRSVSPQALQTLSNQVAMIVYEANQKSGEAIQVKAHTIGERPPGEIHSDHQLVRLAIECHRANGIEAKLNIGSTDANVPLSRGLPAICVGLTTGGGAHTKGEYLDIPPLERGVRMLVNLIQGVFQRGYRNGK